MICLQRLRNLKIEATPDIQSNGHESKTIKNFFGLNHYQLKLVSCQERNVIAGRLDVVSNAIRSIVNSYTSYPYKPKTNNPNLQQAFDKLDDDISEE